MELNKIIFWLSDLIDCIPSIPLFNYESDKRQKYHEALTKSIALLRRLQMCIDLYEDGIKQPIDFDFYEKPQYDKMQVCDPLKQNAIATVDAEWKDKMLKSFIGRVE